MLRKTFWIGFSFVVIYVGVVFSNFSTSTKLQEGLADVGGDSMPIAPYGNAMMAFYNQKKRWPTPSELVLPIPPRKGIVRSVALRPEGELVLTLRGRIWLRSVTVTVALILQPGQDKFGWTSGCLDVTPEAMAGVIYRHCSRTSRAEVQKTQQRVLKMQEESQNERALIADNLGQSTSCHRYAELAHRSNLVACLSSIDRGLGQQVAEGIENFANSPKVTQRQLRLNPSPLEWRNRECDEKWSMLRAAVSSSHPQAGKCFVGM